MSVIPTSIQERLSKGELISVIAQDVESREVLMIAWMNQEALTKTLETKQATYWSRSRNALWLKGESSGHFQEVKSVAYDCDSDAILLQIVQTGAACHTGERSCFHNRIELA
ncbi:unannotated protein [freshwater metagenome]|uniref:Histidine biosynthesis bifunctional protein HisIE n=1 Tax=freshwater metagenome TaxID=449393 RepID=A0A6J6U9N9_9ZZZZ|nr:phosphoribosyl-AMP cyclohydrolase [Actinomycetota bacterium]